MGLRNSDSNKVIALIWESRAGLETKKGKSVLSNSRLCDERNRRRTEQRTECRLLKKKLRTRSQDTPKDGSSMMAKGFRERKEHRTLSGRSRKRGAGWVWRA